MNNIKVLLDEIRELEQSDENKKRKEKWQCIPKTARDLQWRGLPKTDYSWKTGEIPIQVEMNFEFWAKYFNISLKDFYLDKEVFLKTILKITIERFKLFKDDVFISKRIPLGLITAYEASFFNMKVFFSDDIDPWIDHKPIIKDYSDLENLEIPNFKTSGLMPIAINTYEYVKENVEDDFEIFFQEWIRGPFGIATYLRGFENLLVDMLVDPENFNKLMRYITDSKNSWFKEFENFLGIKIEKTNLFNDEVNCPTISPQLYEKMVLPYEHEWCDAYEGGFHYWHSCGDISPLYKHIKKLSNIDMIHKGPWSSAKEVGKEFGNISAIEVCMHPVRDVFECGYDKMKEGLLQIVGDLYDTNAKGFTFRANTLGVFNSIDFSLSKANEWLKAAREVSEIASKMR